MELASAFAELTLGAFARFRGDAVSERRRVDAKSEADSCECVADGDNVSDDRSENEENVGDENFLLLSTAAAAVAGGRRAGVCAPLLENDANRCSFTVAGGDDDNDDDKDAGGVCLNVSKRANAAVLAEVLVDGATDTPLPRRPLALVLLGAASAAGVGEANRETDDGITLPPPFPTTLGLALPPDASCCSSDETCTRAWSGSDRAALCAAEAAEEEDEEAVEEEGSAADALWPRSVRGPPDL